MPRRYAPTALALALAAQCVLVPWIASNTVNSQTIIAWLSVLAVVALSVWLPVGFVEKPRLSAIAALVVIPTFLAISSAATTGGSTFDAPARVLTAITASIYFVSVLLAQNANSPRYGLAIRPLSDVKVPARPPLATPALVLLCIACFFLSVIAPAIVSSTRRGPASNSYLIAMHRAQDAVAHGAGLALAILVALVAGSRLLRGRGVRQSRRARAVAWIIWAMAFSALWWWFARVT